MKIPKKKGNDLFYKAMGGINPTILDEIEEMERMEGQTMKKKMNLVAVAACCVLLMGAGTGLVRHLNDDGGVLFYDQGSLVGGGFTFMYDDIIRAEGEELFYIYEDNNVEISDYCTDDSYFVHPALDENGTGYVVVIGGDEEDRGYSMYHYANGKYLASQSELWDSAVTLSGEFHYEGEFLQINTSEIPANYPLLAWSHHSSKLLGLEIAQDWISLADSIEGDTAQKVGESYYLVQGESATSFTVDEEQNIIRHALDEAGLKGYGPGVYENSDGSYKHFVRLGNDTTWTEAEEATAREILDELGFPCVLELRG